MNFKTTYLLFGMLVLLLGTLGVVLYLGPTENPGATTLFPSMHTKGDPVKTKDIKKIVVDRKDEAGGSITFERVDDTHWKITEPRTMAADSSRVNNLVDSLIEARLTEDEVPGSVSGKSGKPSRTITLHDERDRSWTLGVIEVTPGTENALVYATSSDRRGKVSPIRKQSIESALEPLPYFRNKDLLPEASNDLRSLEVSLGKKPLVKLRKDKDRWQMVEPAYGYVDLTDLVARLADLRVEYKSDKESDFVEDGVNDLAKFNLDASKTDVLRITATRGEGDKARTLSAIVGVSKKIDEDRKYYAATPEGKDWDVVKLTAESVKPLIELVDDPGKYRNKALLALDGFRTPDAIDITNSYGTFEFRRADATKPWELYRGATSNPVDENEVRKLIDELNRKDVITSFADPKRKKELGLEKPDITVKVWADSLEKPDPKKPGKPTFKRDVKPAAELAFGNRERDQVAIERNWEGDRVLAFASQTLLDQVRKGPLAYLDRSVPPYNAGPADQDVTKLEIVRGSESFVMERPTLKDSWKFTKPDALKGRPANPFTLREILEDLNRLNVVEISAEKPDAKDLASTYELAKPLYRVVVTVTRDQKPTSFTFDLGKEIAGKGIYLKRGDRDLVYLIAPSVLTNLKRELRDTSLFSFEPDKVTSLTVRGWKNVTGAVFTLTLEQQDGKWTVKSPAGFNLDSAKASDLVRDLSRLQADRFVAGGKGLKLDEGALQIEMGLPDKKTVSLTVGEPDAAGFFAITDQLKGDTVVIPRGSFEEIKKAPAYFSRK